MLAAKNVKRQAAILFVVALKEPAKLIAVDRIVGGVEVEDDLLWRRRMGFNKEVGQKRFHLPQVGRDLLVPAALIGPRRRQFESIERALAGQRFATVPLAETILSARILFADKHRHQRIVSQLVMVVEIFVAQRQSENPLGDQVADSMLDQFGVTVIGEAIGESSDDLHFRFDFPQQQGPGVGRDGPASKIPRTSRF